MVPSLCIYSEKKFKFKEKSQNEKVLCLYKVKHFENKKMFEHSLFLGLEYFSLYTMIKVLLFFNPFTLDPFGKGFLVVVGFFLLLSFFSL